MLLILLALIQFAAAAVPMIQEQDPLILGLDNLEGLLYEVPEYEDPQMIEHQLSSLGAMPLFTLLEMARKHGDYNDENASQKTKIAETKQAIDDIIYRLETTRTKLEKGNGNIYTDLEKSIQSLKKLERSFRPDIRHVLSSLKASMSVIKPLLLPDAKHFLTTQSPILLATSTFSAFPKKYENHATSVKVISNKKLAGDDKSVSENPSFEVMSMEKPKKTDESVDEIPKSTELPDISKTMHPITKGPFELGVYKKRNRNIDDEDMPTSFQTRWGWKTAGLV